MQVEYSARGRITRWLMNKFSIKAYTVLSRALSLLVALVLVCTMCPVTVQAEEPEYGYVNYDDVRFRKQANSTVVWTNLDAGWVCEIRGTKGDYYYVVTNIPKHLDREYYGYIHEDYLTLMTAEEVATWELKGGNAALIGAADDAEDETEESTGNSGSGYTSFIRPKNASTNYYSFDGNALTSLGLLSQDEAYYVTGTATVNNNSYYIITVNGVQNCYVLSSNMTTLDGSDVDDGAEDDDDSSSTVPVPSVHGTVRITPKGNTNMRSSAAMLSGNIVAKIPQGTELPYYYTVEGTYKTWYYCYDAVSGQYGYIVETCLTVVDALPTDAPTAVTPTSTPKPSDGASVLGYIKITPKGNTNIRKATKVNSNNVVAQAAQGEVLPYYAAPIVNGSTWYYVYYSGKQVFGYVLGSCAERTNAEGVVSPTAPISATSQPDSATPLGYIKLTWGGVNLRKGPSTSTARLDQLDRGTILPYYATEQVGDVTWYKVKTKDDTGYIHGKYCAISDKNGNIGAESGDDVTSGFLYTTKDKVYLRKKASTTAGVYGQIPKAKTVLAIVGASKKANGYTWYNVEYNGNVGYIRNDCVTVLSKEQADAYEQTGVLPTPTPTPTPVPKPTNIIQLIKDNVWLRKSPSTSAGTAGQARLGSVFEFSSTTTVGKSKWYKIDYNGTTCYILGTCAKVLTDAEYNEYLANQPTPTPTPSPTPKPDISLLSDVVITTIEKVIIRASASKSSKQLGLIYSEGTAGKWINSKNYETVNGVEWYNVTIKGVTGWVRGDLIRILTKTEAEMYEQTGDPNAKPEASYTSLKKGDTGEAVTRLQTRLAELGYLSVSNITGTYDSVTKSAVEAFQEDNNITVDGIASAVTQHALYGTVEEGTYNNGSSTTVKLYKPELIDWYTGGIQSIFKKGSKAVVTDVRTGISFTVKRWSGGDHADVEPATAADTAAMCRIYKVKDAQEISDKNYYQRRPLLVTINGHSYCASMYGIPHNYPAGDTIDGNDFYGQFCIHFTNSQLHDGKGKDYPNAKNGYFCHTDAIMEAYNTAAKKLNIK